MYLPDPADSDLWDGLLASWLLSLEADGKSDATLANYRWAPVQLHAWLLENGHAPDVRALTPEVIRGWLVHLGNTRSEATARARYVALRQWVTWLLAEHELDTDPMANVRAPAVHEKPAAMLTPEQVRAVLADCDGPSFVDLRDRALIMLLADTGMRRGAVAGMRVPDVDLRERIVSVVTKGDRHLVVPFGANTARALDRYLRARRRERYADRDWFWLSSTGKGRLTPNGILQAVRRRGRRALGIGNVHPHMFRHTFADAWLAAGGGETDLMEITGWKSRQMVGRYAAARRAVRAREAHRRLSPMDHQL